MSRESEWDSESCESSESSESSKSSESQRVWEWLLSIDMKIKVVQHVKREWMRDWKRERECVKLGEWLLNIDKKQAQAQGACRNDINRAQFHTIGCGFFISNNAEYRTIYCRMREGRAHSLMGKKC